MLASNTVRPNPYYLVVFVLWCNYLYLTFAAPTTAQSTLHISTTVLTILRLSIAVPYLLIWLAASYSFIKIQRYAFAISPSKESGAFSKMATGVSLLLASLILSTLFGGLRNMFAQQPDLKPIFTILTNYSYVFPYLFAFIFLFNSVLDLARPYIEVKISIKKCLLYGIPFAALAYIWLELIFTNPSRITALAASQFATYYLKDSLLILTIAIPSMITWVLGFLTVSHLRTYQQKIKGVLYKRALSSFVLGFGMVIIASIFIQSLLSLGVQRLLALNLSGILTIIYLFLFMQIAGFFLIARGANNLTKIESI